MMNLTALRRCFAVLGVLCAFAGIFFAQSSDSFKTLLIEKIRRGTIEEKRDALFTIRNLETAEASRIAVPALTDSAEIVRATAAFSVVYLPENEAAQVLTPLLKDKSELVRREAAYALGKVGNPNALGELLLVLQKDKKTEVRAASAVALGEIGDAAAIGELLKIFSRKQKSEEEFLRRSAARSIGQIAQIIQTNKVRVITPEDFPPDNTVSVAVPNYANLTETFPIFRPANVLLIRIVSDQRAFESVRREAAFALGEIAETSSIPVLQANLNAADYYLAEIARESLTKIYFYLKRNNSKIPPSPKTEP